MKIRIADKKLGECVITVNKEIGKSEEYAIKSLCMLQLMCMNTQKNDPRFKEFVRVLREATNKAEKIYKPEGEGDADPFEQFSTADR